MLRRLDAFGLNIALYAHQVKRWILWAILPAVLVGAFGYWHTGKDAKTYSASTTLYVQQAASNGAGASGTDPIISSAIAQTYTELIPDATILDVVNQKISRRFPQPATWSVSASQSGSQQNGSQLINVTATDTVQARVAAVANVTAHVFIARILSIEQSRFAADEQSLNTQVTQALAQIRVLTHQLTAPGLAPDQKRNIRATLQANEQIYAYLLSSLDSFRATRDASTNNVSIFSKATPPSGPIGPHPTRTALLYAVVAFLICGGLLFVYDYVNDLARSPEDVSAVAGAPVLGTVQSFNVKGGRSSLIAATLPHSPAAEAYRLIRTNLRYTNVDHPPRTFVITSSRPAEGKSTTASNLAHVFAEGGSTVTLVDADLRRPSLHTMFGQPRGDGLTSLITAQDMNGHSMLGTDLPNLKLVASGPIPPNAADILSSDRMHHVIDHLRTQSQFVFVDSPPVLSVADAAILATMVDGVVLVVDPHRTKRREIRAAREAIDAVGGKLLGVVLNRLRPRGAMYYHYYGQYGYAPANKQAQAEVETEVTPAADPLFHDLVESGSEKA